jgi:hypothetical protein
MLATPAMAEIVLDPGVGVRTVVPCCGNHPNAPRVYVPAHRLDHRRQHYVEKA